MYRLRAALLARPQKNFGRPVEWALVKDYAWWVPGALWVVVLCHPVIPDLLRYAPHG